MLSVICAECRKKPFMLSVVVMLSGQYDNTHNVITYNNFTYSDNTFSPAIELASFLFTFLLLSVKSFISKLCYKY
jgi:hypothetical protein